MLDAIPNIRGRRSRTEDDFDFIGTPTEEVLIRKQVAARMSGDDGELVELGSIRHRRPGASRQPAKTLIDY
ncbi:MAG: hypothetical protein ABIA47_03190 [bacterium]